MTEEMANIQEMLKKQRIQEHERLEEVFIDGVFGFEYEDSDIYVPYFAGQQKGMKKKLEAVPKSAIFESTTDNDYLSLIEAKRHRYVKDKLLLKDFAQEVRKVLLDPNVDPDWRIPQDRLFELL